MPRRKPVSPGKASFLRSLLSGLKKPQPVDNEAKLPELFESEIPDNTIDEVKEALANPDKMIKDVK